jgi:hypothetical protein
MDLSADLGDCAQDDLAHPDKTIPVAKLLPHAQQYYWYGCR